MTGLPGALARGTILVVGLGSIAAVGAYAFSWTKNLDEFQFDPLRVELGRACPNWLEPPMARALFASYQRVAGEPMSTLSGADVEAYRARVEALPWIRSVQLTRSLPRGVSLDLVLERPELLRMIGPGSAGPGPKPRGVQLELVGHGGIRLPVDATRGGLETLSAERFALPFAGAELAPGPLRVPLLLGARLVSDSGLDPAVRAAAAIAEILRDELLPHTRELLARREVDQWVPRIHGIDVSNARSRLVRRPLEAEYRVVVADRGGRAVYLSWGHDPDGEYEVIPWRVKARVLATVLTQYPGLRDIAAADLRFPNRWRDRVVPRRRPGEHEPGQPGAEPVSEERQR